jgi:hypothetical protein
MCLVDTNEMAGSLAARQSLGGVSAVSARGGPAPLAHSATWHASHVSIHYTNGTELVRVTVPLNPDHEAVRPASHQNSVAFVVFLVGFHKERQHAPRRGVEEGVAHADPDSMNAGRSVWSFTYSFDLLSARVLLDDAAGSGDSAQQGKAQACNGLSSLAPLNCALGPPSRRAIRHHHYTSLQWPRA